MPVVEEVLAHHGQFDRLGTPVVEQLVDRGAHRTTRVKDVVDEHDAAAGDLEGQRGCLELRAQPLLRVIVAIEGDVDIADRVLAFQQLLGSPETS